MKSYQNKPNNCETCGKQLTYEEQAYDKDIRGVCSECFQKVIDDMEKEGKVRITKIDGIPHIQLTKRGRREALKEVGFSNGEKK
jgi:predicted amidophosphoribosyltransferase